MHCDVGLHFAVGLRYDADWTLDPGLFLDAGFLPDLLLDRRELRLDSLSLGEKEAAEVRFLVHFFPCEFLPNHSLYLRKDRRYFELATVPMSTASSTCLLEAWSRFLAERVFSQVTRPLSVMLVTASL